MLFPSLLGIEDGPTCASTQGTAEHVSQWTWRCSPKDSFWSNNTPRGMIVVASDTGIPRRQGQVRTSQDSCHGLRLGGFECDSPLASPVTELVEIPTSAAVVAAPMLEESPGCKELWKPHAVGSTLTVWLRNTMTILLSWHVYLYVLVSRITTLHYASCTITAVLHSSCSQFYICWFFPVNYAWHTTHKSTKYSNAGEAIFSDIGNKYFLRRIKMCAYLSNPENTIEINQLQISDIEFSNRILTQVLPWLGDLVSNT